MIHVVFDLDGTLADTEDLVRRAYEVVGVKIPPDAWGHPASTWLPKLVGEDSVEEIHELKNVSYLTLIGVHGVTPLPASALCRELHSRKKDYEVGILTGASYDAATAVRSALNLAAVPLLGVGVAPTQKAEILRKIAPTGLYFDDNLHACELVAEETDWQVLYVADGTTIEDVMRGFKEAVHGRSDSGSGRE